MEVTGGKLVGGPFQPHHPPPIPNKVKLWKQKIPVVFHNLKHYDFHLIMQELAKFNLKKMLYQIDQKYIWPLLSIKSYVFLTAANFDTNVLDLITQKGFYEYISDF